MCLDKLSDFKVRLNENGVGVGWKVFNKTPNGMLFGEWQGRKRRSRNKWLKEGDFRLGKFKGLELFKCWSIEYPYGFHVFITRKGVKNWTYSIPTKVKFRKVVAKGLQCGHRCVVAKEIFIPKERR